MDYVEYLSKIWYDPVWSKVIAGAVLAILGFFFIKFRMKIAAIFQQKKKKDKLLIYQTVAVQEINRKLTVNEIEMIKDLICEQINWYDAITNSIYDKIDSTNS